ncbi:hypothetical protein JG688_00009538 [Phytophthora aleatoria]|uniref:Uncharacterized protein n=1 Tax=Phytophthora aleatoria TaxID=2496075 RepID=A0A8J5J5W6_9STRA|nr:hypothetical protein JG688_00009538 [Phytophthora aleatoria]
MINDGSKLRIHRPIGCEYVNSFNSVSMSALKCNHGVQFVLSGAKDASARRQTALLLRGQSPLAKYRIFLQSGDSDQVWLLQKYNEKWRAYYHDQRANDGAGSVEEGLLRSRAPSSATSVSECFDRERVKPDWVNDVATDAIPHDFLDGTNMPTPDTTTSRLNSDAVAPVGTVANLDGAITCTSKNYRSASYLTGLPLSASVPTQLKFPSRPKATTTSELKPLSILSRRLQFE